MQSKLILGLVGVVVLAGGIYVATMDTDDKDKMAAQENNANVEISTDDNGSQQERSEDNDNNGDQEQSEVVADVTLDVREEEITEDVNDTITADLDYKNGTYTTQESYGLPNGGSHDMDITVVIENDKVSSVDVVFDGDVSGGSTAIQDRFMTAMRPMVVGTDVDSISLSRTGGASLTTAGFNKAMTEIKVKAQS